MTRRQPAFPLSWLMTDERQGDDLWRAILRLPRGTGIIFRHNATPPMERRAMFDRCRHIARQRGLLLLIAADEKMARRVRAAGTHHRRPGPPRYGTASAHNLRELRVAERSGATAILISPIFATRSHPGAPSLGLMRLAALCRATTKPVIALGGMSPRRAIATTQVGAYGWAAIDAWAS